jgi:predicted AAA+ superfamily ATPase
MYKRIIKNLILNKFFLGKAIIIIGARQVGKTTLTNFILEEKFKKDEIIKFNCDNPTDREKLNNKDLEQLQNLIGEKKIIFIDEAQKTESIGQTIKLLVDEYRNKKQVIATGSSSINLLDKTTEALTGRKFVFKLYPLSMEEIYPDKNILLFQKEIEERLVFGAYPELLKTKGAENKKEILEDIQSSSLFKDILEFQAVKNSSVLFSLLKALALQIGSEVSYNELANIVGLGKKTIERYIDLLEKNFIIFRLQPYAVNKRRTISKLRKVFFYDLGIRNAIINNFNALDSRSDKGALWENFMIVERLKFLENRRLRINRYFLRTYDGAEIDLIEEDGGKLEAYEFKFNNKKRNMKANVAGINYKIICPDNIKEFLFS